MKVAHDATANASYLHLSKKPIVKTIGFSEYCFIDLDKEKEVVGIEILFSKKG
ncbi:MAG: DUF2283 domain-containing protein [Patescibacteria group bacterium]